MHYASKVIGDTEAEDMVIPIKVVHFFLVDMVLPDVDVVVSVCSVVLMFKS